MINEAIDKAKSMDWSYYIPKFIEVFDDVLEDPFPDAVELQTI